MSVEDATDPNLEMTPLERERLDWFEGSASTCSRRFELATARDSSGQLVTVHDVRKAIEAGCSLELALKIFT
jgi:hypothetical protein